MILEFDNDGIIPMPIVPWGTYLKMTKKRSWDLLVL